jgi:hypothetical protein
MNSTDYSDKVGVIFMKTWGKYQAGMAVGLPSAEINNNKLFERGVVVLNPALANQVVQPKESAKPAEIPSYPQRSGTATKGIRK